MKVIKVSPIVKAMTPFSIFSLLYMAAFALHMTEAVVEDFKSPALALAFLAIIGILGFASFAKLRWLKASHTFFCFLILSSGYFFLFLFPDVDNHVNLLLYLNIAMAACLAAWAFGPCKKSQDEIFDRIAPFLRSAAVILYFFAGFHKINSDFFDPYVGCAVTFARLILNQFNLHNIAIPVSSAPVIAALIISTEFLGGLLLLVKRFQLPVLVFLGGFHGLLAMVTFPAFSALMMSVLSAFIPKNYWMIIIDNPVNFLHYRIQRVFVYFSLILATGFFTGLYFEFFGPTSWNINWNINFLLGLVLNVASLIFFWPIIRTLLSRKGPKWHGVSIWNPALPKYFLLFLAFLIFFGMNPYLGLRTAGTFTMYSNLVTEGNQSNHLLLHSNALKVFGYQEDVVEIIEITPHKPRNRGNYLRKGISLPVVEFKKHILDWRQMGAKVPAVYSYGGKVYTTQDIVHDTLWKSVKPNWETALLDFRVIQKQGPNACRW